MPEPATILFDGVCNLCNASVQLVIRRDPRARFRFAPLGSDAANEVLRGAGAGNPPVPLPDSILLVQGGRVFTRSGAVLRIARGLRFPWPLLYAFIVVPRPLRDWAYSVVARNRYRWFGKRDSCMMPTPELRSRFLA
jgi:predicted DCC family thiol-disulfide oxidoreductase YuxK